MGIRAHILVKVTEDVDREGIIRLIGDLKELSEVTFAESVVGKFDIIVNVECKSSIEEIVEKIKSLSGIAEIETLKVNPVLPRGRMKKNIAKIPHRAEA